MELVRRNTDFRPQAELEAVGEAGAGIHHDGCGIDLREEALGPSVVLGDDGLRMRGPVAGDVRCVIDGRHHSNCEHRPEGTPHTNRLRRRGRARHQSTDHRAAPKRDAFASRPAATRGRKAPASLVNQKALRALQTP